MSLSLWSEPFHASGSVAAPGVRNALGRPALELPALLAREAIQNSWDAADFDRTGPVEFRVDGHMVSGPTLRVLREEVFRERPTGLPLDEVLSRDEIPVLVLTDTGTTGLGGPTRADVASDESSDFVDFIRNVGQPPDNDFGGGTYGYGKSVLYVSAAASTILVHTRCRLAGSRETRLIGSALGDPYTSEGRRFTGRHWWGTAAEDVGVDPLRGSEGDAIAVALGLPGFGDGCGTSIMIIGAELGVDPAVGVRRMAEATAWYCWPKMVDLGYGAEMRFDFAWEGETFEVPDPEFHPDLREFVAAFRAAETAAAGGTPSGTKVTPVDCNRPIQRLGVLAMRTFLVGPGTASSESPPFEGLPHHVALLREPRMVVRYLEGPPSPVPGTAWAAVFLADRDVDRSFAAAEPPSHDDWCYSVLPERTWDRTFVKVALRRIREATNAFTRPETPSEPEERRPLARVADALGGLLVRQSGPGTGVLAGNAPVGAPGPGGTSGGGGAGGRTDGGRGAGGQGGAGGGRARPQRPELTVIGPGQLTFVAGQPALEIDFEVTPAAGSVSTEIEATVGVLVNEGASVERESPLDAAVPDVLRWSTPGGETTQGSPVLVVEGSSPQRWTITVRVPEDTAVSVDLVARNVR